MYIYCIFITLCFILIGLVFDESLQTCNWPRDVPPPCGTHIPTTVSG